MPTTVKEIEEGATITFRSKNPADLVVWRGTLESVGTYRSIRSHFNPAAYNEAVRQVDPSVPSDITTLTYFMVTVDNDATEPTMLVFAQEWIPSGSLAVLNLGNKVKIEVTDPLNDTQRILSILANAGYATKILS